MFYLPFLHVSSVKERQPDSFVWEMLNTMAVMPEGLTRRSDVISSYIHLLREIIVVLFIAQNKK